MTTSSISSVFRLLYVSHSKSILVYSCSFLVAYITNKVFCVRKKTRSFMNAAELCSLHSDIFVQKDILLPARSNRTSSMRDQASS